MTWCAAGKKTVDIIHATIYWSSDKQWCIRMTDSGEQTIDPTANAFTVAEAAKVARVSEMDIRNWLRRSIVPVGQKNRMGRIAFSQFDILHLRVIGDLNKLLSVDPSTANPIADIVVSRAFQWLQRENQHLRKTSDGKRVETRLIVNLGEDGLSSNTTAMDWGEMALFKIPERGADNQWARGAFVVLPIEQIMHDVLEETWMIIETEQGNA